MKIRPSFFAFAAACALSLSRPSAAAAGPRALPPGTLPDDVRLAPPKDLDGYFPFAPAKTKAAWEERAAVVRRQILVAQGLWPMPTKTPLNAVLHGRIERDGYTIEKVFFESAPGFFVTGNLYRPARPAGKAPAVLFTHGHWKDARFFEETDAKLRVELATGQERFEQGGRNRFQAMCVQLARMGCVVWQWDMLSDADARQFSAEVIHRFAKQRPEMNTTANWGLYSPQAEAHLQSVMGLQTWNAVRSLDFLLTLPEVDPARVAITGASGGGTQTMLLAAIDPRITLSFPAVMVSTAMQGGCTCENTSLLRIGTGNVEFAALFAPKPQGMTTANDWTKEMATKGFPELKQHYALLGAPANVMLHRGEHFPHNYNAVSRSAFFTWLNKHFALGQPEPVVERDYEPLRRAQLTVWDAAHPAPAAEDPAFERRLLAWFTQDTEKQLRAALATPERFRAIAGGAIAAILGRGWANAGEVEWRLKNKIDRGGFVEMTGLLRNTTHGEELPVAWLHPKQGNGRAVVWLDDTGKSALFAADGTVKPAVLRLVESGATVLGADLLLQGEFLADGTPLAKTRTVKNPREFAGYTFGYNPALFAQRTHDVLTLVAFLRHAKSATHASPSSVSVAGFGAAGPIVAAARALAGPAIDRAAIDTGGFRFGQLLDYRDPRFLPGGAKYLDVPGLLALGAPHATWLAGEGATPEIAAGFFRGAGAEKNLTAFAGPAAEREAAAQAWLAR
jgi:dienelactone hydrolase